MTQLELFAWAPAPPAHHCPNCGASAEPRGSMGYIWCEGCRLNIKVAAGWDWASGSAEPRDVFVSLDGATA